MMEWKNFETDFDAAFRRVPHDRPYLTLNKGRYRGNVDFGGVQHPYYAYFPQEIEYSGRNITILLSDEMDVDDFLERTGWANLAEKEHLLLLLFGGKDDPLGVYSQQTEELLEALNKARCARTYMDNQYGFSCLIGYGSAADVAHRYVLRIPNRYCAAAFAGRIAVDEDELKTVGESPSRASDIPLKEVPQPVAFLTSQKEEDLGPVIAYWKYANKSEEEAYEQAGAKIWMPDMAQLESVIDHQPVARVEYIRTEDPCTAPVTANIWYRFLALTQRQNGAVNNDLHPYRSPEQWHLTRQEREIDGWMRHWYEYVPGRAQILTDGKYPLVIYLHGGSSTGITGLNSSEWVQVAKERGFIVAMPTGAMRHMGDNMPHPAWNASRDPEIMDDEKFIREIISDISSRYPVDQTRIYVNGHSMGSAMTQRLALCMPELFAAVCSNSGVIAGGFMGGLQVPGVREDFELPVWIQMGENDVGGGTMENNPKAKFTVEYWCGRNHVKPGEFGSWRDGRYLNREWANASGVPMVRYTTTLEKPHSQMGQDAWFYYDEWMSRFSRVDGEIYYEGRPIHRMD